MVFDGKMWVFGGGAGTTYYNDVWYSPDGATWASATDSADWEARAGHTSIVFNDTLWILGGSGSGVGAIYRDAWYSMDGVTWTCATDSAGWAARSGHTSVVFDNKMWVIGGRGAGMGNNYDDVWYSTDGIIWTCATDSAGWEARSGHTSVVFDTKMWVIGGSGALGATYGDAWYSVDGATWLCATDSTEWLERATHASDTMNNKIWVIGGRDSLYNIYNDIWCSGGIAIEEKSNIKNQISRLEILQNPFITSTDIKYYIPARNQVSLGIYDMSGRMVKILVSGEKEIGNYKVNFDARGLTAGIYFVELKTGSCRETQKIVLMR